MKITKEQIIALDKKEVTVKELFPSVFAPEFKNGDWIKLKNGYDDCLIFITDYENSRAYGFYKKDKWIEDTGDRAWSFKRKDDRWRLATNEEVFEALKNEAVKRGFELNANHTITNGKEVVKIKEAPLRFCYISQENSLLLNNWRIFENGIWAEIIPTITKKEAEKLLNKVIID